MQFFFSLACCCRCLRSTINSQVVLKQQNMQQQQDEEEDEKNLQLLSPWNYKLRPLAIDGSTARRAPYGMPNLRKSARLYII